MVPVIELEMHKYQGQWPIIKIAPFPFQDLEDPEQDFFIESIEMFSTKVWRRPKQEKKYRYDIAMLVDSDEKCHRLMLLRSNVSIAPPTVWV